MIRRLLLSKKNKRKGLTIQVMPLVGASLIAVLGGDILVRGAMRKAKA